MRDSARRPARGALLSGVLVVAVLASVLPTGLASAAGTPATIGVQASDVPGFAPTANQTIRNPTDQGMVQSFLHCAQGNPLLGQFDTGPDATVSGLYGQGTGPLGTSADSVFSVVFTDGSASDAAAAYAVLTGTAFSSCWSTEWGEITTAITDGLATVVTPFHVEPLTTPTVGGADVSGYSLDGTFSALGVTLSDSVGVTAIGVGAFLAMLVTVGSGQSFPTTLRGALTTAIAQRMGAVSGSGSTTGPLPQPTPSQSCRRSGIPDDSQPVLTTAQVDGIVHARAQFTGETTNGSSVCVWSAKTYSRITNGSAPAARTTTWQVLVDGPLGSDTAARQAYEQARRAASVTVSEPDLGDTAALVSGTQVSPGPRLLIQAGSYFLMVSSAAEGSSPTLPGILHGLATALLVRLKLSPAHSSKTISRKQWPTDWAGRSFCATHYRQPFLATFRGVASCGETFRNDRSNTQGPICYPVHLCRGSGIMFDTVGFQCVEYAERYFYYMTGIRTLPLDPGSDIAEAIYYKFQAKNPGLGLVPKEVLGGTTRYAPSLVKGDIVSMWSAHDTVGHVAVVTRVRVTKHADGKYYGRVTMINQNAQGGITHLTVNGSTLTYDDGYFTTFQWLTGLPTS